MLDDARSKISISWSIQYVWMLRNGRPEGTGGVVNPITSRFSAEFRKLPC